MHVANFRLDWSAPPDNAGLLEAELLDWMILVLHYRMDRSIGEIEDVVFPRAPGSAPTRSGRERV